MRLKQIRVKASEEKRGRSERSKKITEREKSCAKIEKKIVVRKSDQIVKSSVEQSGAISVVQNDAE